MEKSEIKKKAEEIIDSNKLGTLATVKDGKPFSRYMTFFNDDFTLYSATDKETHKVDDIEENNNVHILLGFDEQGLNDSYLEIEGKASIQDSTQLKEKVWNDDLEPWFEGPNDPNYVVLEIDPTEIRLMNTESNQPEIVDM